MNTRRLLLSSIALLIIVGLFVGLSLLSRPVPRPRPFVSFLASPFLSPLEAQVKTPTPVPTPAGGMLQNSSLEEPYRCVPGQTGYCVPYGWSSWRENPPHCRPDSRPGRPPCDIPCPNVCERANGSCNPEYGCFWAAPEFTSIGLNHPERVHSGLFAFKLFASGRMWDAGIYQSIYHVTLRSLVTFSVWVQAWQCVNYDRCQYGRVSDEPANMNISIGIDPYGGIDPYSDDVVWTVGESFDVYRQFSVTTVARNQVITVFVRGAPRWTYPRGNGNDLYLDDARLDVVEVDWSHKQYLGPIFGGE